MASLVAARCCPAAAHVRTPRQVQKCGTCMSQRRRALAVAPRATKPEPSPKQQRVHVRTLSIILATIAVSALGYTATTSYLSLKSNFRTLKADINKLASEYYSANEKYNAVKADNGDQAESVHRLDVGTRLKQGGTKP